ncbi:DNA replication factor Cdt1-like isoform X2 [Anopheles albimanus]|uniref:DNA replication factor Cdt1-like isoform X2 n=1 Tax=Anopheles albimanus TaxID=7167 RepID=UPI00163F8D21|nr:DNA replication factor Cdt1-like isoform X2 [Anopheles albimanus]
MSQPTVASYFNTRKRAAAEHLGGAHRNKSSDANGNNVEPSDGTADLGRRVTRASRAIKRIGTVELDEKTKALLSTAQPKLVSFVKKGNLSPQKRVNSPAKPPIVPAKKLFAAPKEPSITTAVTSSTSEAKEAVAEFSPRNSVKNVEKGNKAVSAAAVARSVMTRDKDSLTADEIRGKLLSHPRLPDLKAKLKAVQDGMKELKRMERERLEGKQQLKPPASPGTAAKNLKEFNSLEVEVMVSPKKTFMSPTKMLKTPTKNAASPSKNVTPKSRLSELMSPIKDASAATPIMASPKKVPAYQRFHALAIAGPPSLHLPYKYRSLLELFKCIDTVISMFHNRKEQITFKKLKPAVQRMARKNFFESHLAQIQHLYPGGAYVLTQELTKNYGSATKHDTYQLVIQPKVEAVVGDGKKDEDASFLRTLQNQPMNPQVMLDRQNRFHRLLLEKVKDAHEAFLRAHDPPLTVDREKIVRWHMDFDLESCPDIEQAELPKPPNVEKFSSARDILSTARNLFNCATPIERALQRLEEKKQKEATIAATATLALSESDTKTQKPSASVKEEQPSAATSAAPTPSLAEYDVFKNIPKALLEKIRAKQAAKALDQMTRRPSQEKEAIKYSRLPELARHLRNVFVTERKNVLPLETPLVKIENSYRGKLTLQELEEHIRLIAQLVPFWLTLPEVRKVKYAKMAKDCDLAKVIGVLERKANEVVQ